MKHFLVIVILCSINISRAGYFKRNLEQQTSNPAVSNHRQFTRNSPRKYDLSSGINNRLHRRNRAFYDVVKDNDRLIHPHKYWYVKNLRNSNPSFLRRSLPLRNTRNSMRSNYRRNEYNPAGKSDLLARNDRSKSYSSRINRNSNNVNVSGSGLKLVAPRGRINKPLQRKTEDSNVTPQTSDGAKSTSGSTGLEKLSLQEGKRDLLQKKYPEASTAKKIYRSLRKFDLLYLLGLFLIFIPLASFTLIILPIASFCWSRCRSQKAAKVASEPSLNDVTVETALVENAAAPPENPKPAVESKSFKEMYNNFVSNEIDGDGDTVGKRMKLERWMEQDSKPQQKSPRPKRQHRRHFYDMESVTEDPSDAGSSSVVDDAVQYQDSEQSEGRREMRDDVPDISQGRTKEKPKRNRRANRQDSQPFDVADNVIAVGRVHNARLPNTRQIHTIPRYHPRRTSYSMVDVPQHCLRY